MNQLRTWMNLCENAGDEYVYDVSVENLNEIYHPFEHPPWFDTQPISTDEVQNAIADKQLNNQPHEPNVMKPASKEYHIQRIAYLVIHPDHNPITIVPTREGSFTLDDGFHRLMAAIYRGDRIIKVEFGGTKQQLARWLTVG